jgi:hypothetical protein
MGAAAGWHADPFGRFDHRYWDGERWTEHVSTAGQQAVDPPVPGPPPPVTAPPVAGATPVAGAAPIASSSALDTAVLMFKEQFAVGGYRTNYTVFDEVGEILATVRQVNQRSIDLALFDGQDLSSGGRAELEVRDPQGQLLLHVLKPRSVLKASMVVCDGTGAEVGRLRQEGLLRFSCFLEAQGRRWGEMRFAGRTGKALEIKDHTGAEVARLERFVENAAVTIFTNKDNMRLRVHRPLTDPLRSLVFCAPFLVEAALNTD